MRPFIDGIMTGILLQLAIGPVFFYILGITIDSNYTNSLAGILAVTLADYIYICLSLIGIGKFLKEDRVKHIFGVVSAGILFVFGVLILLKGISGIQGFETASGKMAWTPLNSFATCFTLTISNPLTIIFWTGIFSAKAIEKKYVKRQLAVFGLATGSATFLFLGFSMLLLSFFKASIPQVVVQGLNTMVGVVLICYGLMRIIQIIRPADRVGV